LCIGCKVLFYLRARAQAEIDQVLAPEFQQQ
jgi:hypothetical protein